MKTLHLDAISPLWGHMLLSRLKVPFTYTWYVCRVLVVLILTCTRSSTLIPKPQDWGAHINITGFSFLKAAPNYQPPEDLVQFLEAGPPPIYVGFGSIVVEKPEMLTKIIFGAVKRAGVRALVSQGWGGLGEGDAPEGIFLLGNCPHDWLFQHVSCVVHHGGAGTNAIGIAMGKPTIVIPFFGDQPFWGAMIHRAGAGPEPVPYRNLTEEKLAEAITKALAPDIQNSVKEMSERITSENGSEVAAATFNHSINYDRMCCLICPDQVAVWRIKNTNIRLSTLAIATLADNSLLSLRDLTLYVT
jgi:sterol 3beta-glucosyltransferase